MKRSLTVVAFVSIIAGSCSSSPDPVRVGAVYPLTGAQGYGGADEFHGVQIAARLVNEDGGIDGRPIQLVPMDAESADAAPQAVAELHAHGIDLVIGSYGSTISSPAAEAAARRGMLFWETGAVGDMTGAGAGDLVFRVAPTGVVLGGAAIRFVADQLAPLLHRDPTSLRFAIANVDDSYGDSVARGAEEEFAARGLKLVGRFPYDPHRADIARVVGRIAKARPDVLFVAAYLRDGIELRRQTVRQGLHLLASIGTSSSYCMPAFGRTLGADAVGVFASDKPYEGAIDPSGLTAGGRALLVRAGSAYRERFGTTMSAAALAGFSGAWVLFHDAMPRAASMTPAAVAAAARALRVPTGGLPNGSGVEFGAPGTADAGANLRASSVIWEWTGIGQEEVVWPPRFAEASIRALPLAP